MESSGSPQEGLTRQLSRNGNRCHENPGGNTCHRGFFRMASFTLTPGADVFPPRGENTSGNDGINSPAGIDIIHGTGNDGINGVTGPDQLFGDGQGRIRLRIHH